MTLNPNANWTTENTTSEKFPVYTVIFPDVDADVHFITHNVTTDADYYTQLAEISGVSQTFNPIRSEASIGGFKFTLTNVGNNIIDGTFWDLDDLKDEKVIVEGGYYDLAVTDYETIQVGYVYNIERSAEGTGYVFTCQDLQNLTDKDIFTGATPGSPDSISVRNIVTFWLQVMASTGNPPGPTKNGPYDVLDADQGLAITAIGADALIDVTEVERIRDDFLPTWNCEFTFTGGVNAKTFFQDEIFRAYGLIPVIKANGLISLRVYNPPIYGYSLDNNQGTTLDDDEIVTLPEWNMNFRDIINQIIFNYDYDEVDNEYDTQTTYNNSASQAKHGVQSLTINSKGIHTANDGLALTSKIANKYFRRYAEAPITIRCKTWFTKRIVEAADQLLVNSSHITNLDSSNTTWTNRVGEVEKVSPNYRNGNIDIQFRDINVGTKKYGVIAPAGTNDHPSATAAELLRYAWVSPTTDATNYYII